jgi:hypothetical protein
MKRKKIKFFLFLFLVLVLARFLVVPYMGSWLVKGDELQPADAMVMLMGSVSDRESTKAVLNEYTKTAAWFVGF